VLLVLHWEGKLPFKGLLSIAFNSQPRGHGCAPMRKPTTHGAEASSGPWALLPPELEQLVDVVAWKRSYARRPRCCVPLCILGWGWDSVWRISPTLKMQHTEHGKTRQGETNLPKRLCVVSGTTTA